MRDYIKWVAAVIIILCFVILAWTNKADAQSPIPQYQIQQQNRSINCFLIDDKFEKEVISQYDIIAAGIVPSPNPDVKVMSLVFIKKDLSTMMFAEMVDSKHLCVLSGSLAPRISKPSSYDVEPVDEA